MTKLEWVWLAACAAVVVFFAPFIVGAHLLSVLCKRVGA